MTILFIADTHGDLAFHPEWLDNLPQYDLCILLGDHSTRELEIIKSKIEPQKLFGVLGNHDSPHYALLAHDESMQIAERLGGIDILVSHDKPYTADTNDTAHDGLKGITHAIYKSNVQLHFHGHLHKPNTTTLKNGCKSRCIYGIECIQIK